MTNPPAPGDACFRFMFDAEGDAYVQKSTIVSNRGRGWWRIRDLDTGKERAIRLSEVEGTAYLALQSLIHEYAIKIIRIGGQKAKAKDQAIETWWRDHVKRIGRTQGMMWAVASAAVECYRSGEEV